MSQFSDTSGYTFTTLISKSGKRRKKKKKRSILKRKVKEGSPLEEEWLLAYLENERLSEKDICKFFAMLLLIFSLAKIEFLA